MGSKKDLALPPTNQFRCHRPETQWQPDLHPTDKDLPMRSFRTKGSVSPARPKSTPERDHFLYRTHKIVLDPTPDEERLLTRTADYARAAYNWGLRCYMDGDKAEQELTIDTLRGTWNAIKGSKYPWGKRMAQKAADYAFDALSHAIRAWKDPRLEDTAPRFHSRTRKTAFRIGDRDDRVYCQGQYVELPRIGKIRMVRAPAFVWQPP